jgi:surface protein
MFVNFGLSPYFDQSSSASFSCALTKYNRPSFPASVFHDSKAFNGDLKQWDVSKVTNMEFSKSKLVVEKT